MHTHTTIYSHATILTLDPSRRIIIDGAIVVQKDTIVAVDKTNNILTESVFHNAEVIDCTNRIILPGLINTHAHLAQSLLRGLAEELPLHSWLCDRIWPLEANFGPDDGYVGARLTIAEMLKSGTTCFLEAMLTHRSGFHNVARAVDEMGIRACLVCILPEKAMHNPKLISSRANWSRSKRPMHPLAWLTHEIETSQACLWIQP
jgi:cytosine/adenosine deaminase-related metal-dependent hydrolase